MKWPPAVAELKFHDLRRTAVRTAHNSLLIASQRPSATRVAGFRAWKKLGRHVRKGEKGIVILAPVVRELRNTIERAMILEDTAWIQVQTLGIHLEAFAAGASSQHQVESAPIHEGLSLEEAERAIVVDALKKTDRNQSRAARLLKITRDTLRYKMKKFNLQQE